MSKALWDNNFPASGSSFSSSNMRNQFQSLYQGDIAPLRPRAHVTQDMGIMIAGSDVESFYRQTYSDGDTRVIGSGNVTFVAPNFNNRIDVVYSSGTVFTHVSGIEAASPTVPSISSVDEDVIPICLVYHQVGETKIVNYEDTGANPSEGYIYRDVRPVIHSSTIDGTQFRNLENIPSTAGVIPAANVPDSGVAKDGTVNPTNLLINGDFETWTAGASAAPDGWTLSDGGATIAREGTIIKLGTYSSKITRSGATAILYQTLDTARGIEYWKNRTVTFGCWVYATVASRARILVYNAVPFYSSYHTGDSTWQWLTATGVIDNATTAGNMGARCIVSDGDTSAYFDGAILVEGASAFAFSPKPTSSDDSSTVPLGSVVQVVNYQRSDEVTTTTDVPYNNSTRTSSEGNQILTVAITPKSNSNKLKIDISAVIGGNAEKVCLILMDGTTVLSTARIVIDPINMIQMTYWVTSPGTSAKTYNVNMGSSAGDLYLNKAYGDSLDNGKLTSSITITEIKG